MESFFPSASRNHDCALPPQLLAQVLARLEPAERLGTMATVCSTWRTAAVLATNSISAQGRMCWDLSWVGISQEKATALSGWLQAHAAAAAPDSLAVQGDPSHPHLQLAVQQLASLRSLDLESVRIAVQGGANAQAATTHPDLPLELSGMTRLRLWRVMPWRDSFSGRSSVALNTLPFFTNLRHLALSVAAARNSSLMLSSLLHLTHLDLAWDCAQDAVLASMSCLTCLQELEVMGSSYTADGLAALPLSLTKLCVGVHGQVALTPDSTPAVAQLTALQWLEVTDAAGFSTAVLRNMSSLQHLAVQGTPLLPAASAGDESDGGDDEVRGVDLSVLRGLTQLQHLELPGESYEHAAAGTDADVAALTASSQLTCLNIERLVEQQHYSKIFPAGRQLLELKELQATKGLLGTAEDAEALVRCCPNLEELDVGCALDDEAVLEEYEGSDYEQWCSIVYLEELTSLTRLTINVTEFECNEVFWPCIGKLQTLRNLDIRGLDMYFGGIVVLTSCQELTSLRTCSSDGISRLNMQTLEGQPPDIWRRLPREALKEALRYYRVTHDHDDLDSEGALRSIARAVAGHTLGLDCQLQQEVGELRATVATLENRLQQQDERLQQQDKQLQAFAGLQATVAAMGAQLQALLPQTNMQQG